MPLTEHLRELRNRLAVSVVAIVIITIVAMFFAKDIMNFLTDPVPKCGTGDDTTGGNCATLTQSGVTNPFATYLKVSLLVGLLGASPVWLHQAWAFIAPGLHQHEKKYTRAVVGVGVPLFLSGAYLAYWIMPRALPVLLSFTADNAQNLISVEDVLDILVRMAIGFGLAFELPLLLVLLNFGGLLSGKTMLSWWRWMVVGIAVFAAAITPTDLLSMLALQLPVTGLYFIAVGIALFNDRSRRRRDPDAGLSDDEASELDLAPADIELAEPVAPATADERAAGATSFDDAT